MSSITPKIDSITLVDANQEYFLLLSNVKKISFKIFSGGNIRFAYQPNQVSTSALPYYSLNLDSEEIEDFYNDTFTGILYLASSTPNTTVLVKTWK